MDSPYAGEKFDCDVVMKGGITSGVVYPGAIDALARQFRFRAIGGTSAGAIAAAIVAAAEYRRQLGPGEEPGRCAGFEDVAALPERLGEKRHGQRLLMGLFQPDRATRGVFRILRAYLVLGALPVVGRFAVLLTPAMVWPAFPLWVIAGLALLAVGVFADLAPAVAVIAIVAGAAVAALGPPARIAMTFAGLPANGFGLCRLGPDAAGRGDALTPWLHEQIQKAAGRTVEDAVLTFGDLWGIDPDLDPTARREAALALCRDAGARTVDLQMMTTDLTHGLPLRLPSGWHRDGATSDPAMDDGGGLVFDPEELRGYFPKRVVRHLAERGGVIGGDRTGWYPEGWRRFPLAEDLPVVVAARMSLSFPVLIAAVPLWDRDFEREMPRRVLFSDGGITSNFPVHFFDAPLPRRPTFGLDLAALPRDVLVPDDPDDQAVAVGVLPQASDVVRPTARDIDRLGPFLSAIKDAMQNWRDNLQALQPGYRDRIIPVMLGSGEGGMALNMKARKITALSHRGGIAGDRLAERFAVDDDGAHTGWNDHRLARLRITMAAVEPFMESFERGWTDPPDAPGVGDRTRSSTMSYTLRVQAANEAPYEMSVGQIARAPVVAQAYRDTLQVGEAGPSLQPGAPRPRSLVRVVPPA